MTNNNNKVSSIKSDEKSIFEDFIKELENIFSNFYKNISDIIVSDDIINNNYNSEGK